MTASPLCQCRHSLGRFYADRHNLEYLSVHTRARHRAWCSVSRHPKNSLIVLKCYPTNYTLLRPYTAVSFSPKYPQDIVKPLYVPRSRHLSPSIRKRSGQKDIDEIKDIKKARQKKDKHSSLRNRIVSEKNDIEGDTNVDSESAQDIADEFISRARNKSRPRKGKVAIAAQEEERIPSYSRRVEGFLNPSNEKLVIEDAVAVATESIPQLSHGLDRVLFNPGVHWLQDPRCGVYNFPPALQSLPDVGEFAFERLPPYIKSSQDERLHDLAVKHEKRFVGSTSSLTGLLSQIYFVISGSHPVDTSILSRAFDRLSTAFTSGQRMPISFNLNFRDGVYAFDSSDPGLDRNKNILLWMGTMLEYFLTWPMEQFQKLLRSSAPDLSSIDKKENYRFSKTDSFIIRAQLDCYDPRLPGTGVFDIKTRAALPIRLDSLNYEENSGYLIRTLQGPLESFEKEYYDLIRSAFLKYTFQARLGAMDGVFLAYHNTARLFGFQYIPLEEMEERLFGAKNRGDRVFEKCIKMLETLAEEIVTCFPEQSVRCTAETLPGSNFLRIWIEPESSEKDEVSPIVQLNVSAISYIDGKRVPSAQAVDNMTADWVLRWSISRSSLSSLAIRKKLKAAKERQFRAYILPSGVSENQVADMWLNLNFGSDRTSTVNPTDEERASIDTTRLFRKPSRKILMLRNLARAGHNDTERANTVASGEKVLDDRLGNSHNKG